MSTFVCSKSGLLTEDVEIERALLAEVGTECDSCARRIDSRIAHLEPLEFEIVKEGLRSRPTPL